jgi:hypothetical protein
MNDVYDYLATAVEAIRSDEHLKNAFNEILKFGSSTQQVRVSALLNEVTKMNAPEDLKKFIQLLGNDKLAHQLLNAINS